MARTRLRGNQLKVDSVASDRIKDFTITAVDIAPGSLDGAMFVDGSIPAEKFDLTSFPGPGLSLLAGQFAVNVDDVDLTIVSDVVKTTALVTKLGNTFNGADQLVQLDGAGKLPALDGSALTGISVSQWINSGSDIYFAAGSVGIGGAPTAPGFRLSIEGTDDTADNDLLRLSKSNYGSTVFTSYSNGGDFGIRIHGSSGPANAFVLNASNGHIGLGTSDTPSAPLHVKGSGGISLLLEDDVDTAKWVVGPLGGGTNRYRIGEYGVGDWLYMAAGTGNVGLGIQNPAYKLDVSGDVNVTGGFYVNGVAFNGGGTPGGSDTDIQFKSGSTFSGDSRFQFDTAGYGNIYLRTERIHFGDSGLGYGVFGRISPSSSLTFGESSDTGEYRFRTTGQFIVESNVIVGGFDSVLPFAAPRVEVIADNNAAAFLATVYGSQNPTFAGIRAGGSQASPAATNSGDKLVIFSGLGHDGTGLTFTGSGGEMHFTASQTWSTGVQGTNWELKLCADGSASHTDVMTATATGGPRLGIGTTSPATTLHVAGATQIHDTASDQYAFWASNGPTLGGVRVWGLGSGASANRVSIGQGTSGIGVTPDPNCTLTVFGSTLSSSNLQGGVQNVFRVQNPNSPTPANNAEARVRFQVGTTSLGQVGVAGVGGLIEDVSTGSGSIIFSTSLATTLAEKMRLTSAGRLGLGTSSPATTLAVTAASTVLAQVGVVNDGIPDVSGSRGGFVSTVYTSGANNGAGLRLMRANGSLASPTAVASGDRFGIISGVGHDGSAFPATGGSFISFNATENWTPTAHGSNIVFSVNNPTTLVSSTPMVIQSSSTGAARVGISQTNPLARLDIGSASLGGANISGTSPAWTLGYTNVIFGKSDAGNAWGLGELIGDAVVKNTSGAIVLNGGGAGNIYVKTGSLGVARINAAAEGPFPLEVAGPIVSVGNSGVGTSGLVRALDYGNGSAGLSMYAADGTEASPLAVTTGYQIGFIGAKGFDGTNFSQTGSRGAIQFSATENWTPTAQGTQIRFRVTSNGTTSNLFAFRIDPNGGLFGTSAAGADSFLSLQSGGAKQWIMASENSTGSWTLRNQSDSLNPIYVEAGAPTNGLYLASGGIGVGHNAPSEALDVNGSVVVRGAFFNTVASSGGISYDAGNVRLVSRGPDGSTNGGFQMISTAGDGSNILFPLSIDTLGKVGIGTTSPSAVLHVDGSTLITGYDANPPVAAMLKIYHATLGVQPILMKTDDSDFAVIKHRDGNVLEMGTADRVFGSSDQIYVNEATGTVALARNALDSVGVGTSSPSAKLHVAGTARIDAALTLGADADAGGFKITNAADPTLAQDLATKMYVDMVATGLTLKSSVLVATTADITLAGAQTIDGVALVGGERVLVKNQATAADNGIYIVVDPGAWTRSGDADNTPGSEVNHGMFTFVQSGATNAGQGYVLITNDPITLGVTALTFTQFSSAPSVQFVTREIPSGLVDSANRYYELAQEPSLGSEELFKNGILQDNASESLSSPFGAGLALVNGDAVALTPNTNGYAVGQVITQYTGPQEALAVIESIVTDTSVTFTAPWAGSNYGGAIYLITIAGDYAIRGKTIAFATAPTSGDKVRTSYRY